MTTHRLVDNQIGLLSGASALQRIVMGTRRRIHLRMNLEEVPQLRIQGIEIIHPNVGIHGNAATPNVRRWQISVIRLSKVNYDAVSGNNGEHRRIKEITQYLESQKVAIVFRRSDYIRNDEMRANRFALCCRFDLWFCHASTYRLRFFEARRGLRFDLFATLFGFSRADNSRRFFAAQPGLLTWRPRAIPNPSAGTFSVMVEPAAM